MNREPPDTADAGVLVVIASNKRRGAELEGAELARQLTLHGKPAQCVALCGSEAGPAIDVPVLGPSPLHFRTLRELRRRAQGARVVVAYGSSTLPACALALAVSRRPFLYRSIGNPRDWTRGRLHRARTALLFRRPCAVVALWPEAAESLSRLYRISSSRVVTIPNARDAAAYPVVTASSRAEARSSLGVSPDGPVVGYIGALSPEKRPELALASVRLVPGAQLLVAGAGVLEPKIRASGAQDQSRVKILGGLDDVVPVIHASDVLLLTSRTEGMPGVLIEASLCGVPFVATAVGAVAEVCEPPSETVHVGATEREIADAIQRTIERQHDPVEISRAALDRYGWKAVVPSWLRLLERY
jgi:glycosyltransferase involved in cell wall biosynthesis